MTVKVVEPEPVLPARSVAFADSGCAPAPNDQAGPFVFAHVDEATPDRASAPVHVMATVSRTEYVLG
jgi:hypothetical protein